MIDYLKESAFIVVYNKKQQSPIYRFYPVPDRLLFYLYAAKIMQRVDFTKKYDKYFSSSNKKREPPGPRFPFVNFTIKCRIISFT